MSKNARASGYALSAKIKNNPQGLKSIIRVGKSNICPLDLYNEKGFRDTRILAKNLKGYGILCKYLKGYGILVSILGIWVYNVF